MSSEVCTLCHSEEEPSAKPKAGKTKAKKAGKGNRDISTAEINWVLCEACLQWTHVSCAKIPNDIYNHHKDNPYSKYYCENCEVKFHFKGTYVEINSKGSSSTDVAQILTHITELQKEILKLNNDLIKLQGDVKKADKAKKSAMSRLHSKINTATNEQSKDVDYSNKIKNLEHKIKNIEKGFDVSEREQKQVNRNRIVISKVPYRNGENLKQILKHIWTFHNIEWDPSNITNYYRVRNQKSKENNGTDYCTTPHIIVIFKTDELKRNFMNSYFKKYKNAVLDVTKTLASKHRFIINEVLTYNSFVIRNLALQHKRSKQLDKVFVRNNNVFVRKTSTQNLVKVDSLKELDAVINPGQSDNIEVLYLQGAVSEQMDFSRGSISINDSMQFYDAEEDL